VPAGRRHVLIDGRGRSGVTRGGPRERLAHALLLVLRQLELGLVVCELDHDVPVVAGLDQVVGLDAVTARERARFIAVPHRHGPGRHDHLTGGHAGLDLDRVLLGSTRHHRAGQHHDQERAHHARHLAMRLAMRRGGRARHHRVGRCQRLGPWQPGTAEGQSGP
jgi:hypothetical protein